MRIPQFSPKQQEKLVALLFIIGLLLWTLMFVTVLSNC